MKKKLIVSSILLSGMSTFAQINQNSSGQTGLGTTAPANRLEIKSTSSDPYGSVISTNGASGLRFSNLNSTKTPITNPSTNVLTVDANGDVILVPDGGGIGTFGGAQNGCSATTGGVVVLGNNIGGSSAQLTSSRQIPQGNNGLFFSGNAQNDRFQIGGSAIGTAARLSVDNYYGTGLPWSYGIRCYSDADASNTNVGIHALVQDKSSSVFAPTNLGLYLKTSGSGIQKGFYVESQGTGAGDVFGLDLIANTNTSGTGDVTGARIDAKTAPGHSLCVGISSKAALADTNLAGHFASYSTSSSIKSNIGAKAEASGGLHRNTGLIGSGSGLGTLNFGVRGNAGGDGSTNNGVTSNANGNNGSTNYGLRSFAGGNVSWNYGIYTEATGLSSVNYALYAKSQINNSSANWAGFFDGDVEIQGTNGLGGGTSSGTALQVNGGAWMTGGIWGPSDRRFKTNILPLESVSEKIKKLSGYTYTYKTEDFKSKNFPQSQQIGFIAQELKEVFPQLVKEDKEGYYSVNYIGFIPVLLQSIKEQQQQIEELKAANSALANRSFAGTTDLSNQTSIAGFQLSQNVPNPFTHETVIKYTIPASTKSAYMAIYDLTGKQITTMPVEQKGDSSITITAEKLSPGIYIYSIVADGQVIDSKRMVVAQQ